MTTEFPSWILKIQHDVCARNRVRLSALVGPRRDRKLVLARYAAIRRAYALGASSPQIGRAFHRHHTTILHACGRIGHKRAKSAPRRVTPPGLILAVGETRTRTMRDPSAPAGSI